MIHLVTSFLEQADLIWREYQSTGPGSLDPQRFERLQSQAETLKGIELRADLEGESASDAIAELDRLQTQLLDLAERCVMRTEGLCFISGEAGLLPRRDLHEKYEASLDELRLWIETQSRNFE